MDNQHIGMIKLFLASPQMSETDIQETMVQIQRVMDSKQRLYVRFVRKSLRSGHIYLNYPFETKDIQDRVIEEALHYMHTLLSMPVKSVPSDIERLEGVGRALS